MSLEEARRLIENFVEHYNTKRLHSAIGYVASKDKLGGKDREILAERDRKLHEAREGKRQKRLEARAERQRTVAETVVSA